MTEQGTLIAVILLSYLLGSIPFGLVVGRLSGVGDIRKSGSGNIGATNMLRVGGKKLGALTMLLDMLKAALPVAICQIYLSPQAAAIAALSAVFGHVFSVFLGFKGGKGVATGIGALISLNALVGALVIVTWLVVAKLSKYSSLAALVAFAAAAVYMLLLDHHIFFLTTLGVSMLIILRHRANIIRLLNRNESKIKL